VLFGSAGDKAGAQAVTGISTSNLLRVGIANGRFKCSNPALHNSAYLTIA
jgi:hypothetical protein